MCDTSTSRRSIQPIHLLDWLLDRNRNRYFLRYIEYIQCASCWYDLQSGPDIINNDGTCYDISQLRVLFENVIAKQIVHWRLRLIPGIFSQIYWTCSQTAGDGWNQKSADWVEMYIRYKPQQVPASQRERTQRSFSLRDVCVCLFVCQYVYVFVYDWVEMYNKRQKIPARQDRPRERTQRICFQNLIQFDCLLHLFVYLFMSRLVYLLPDVL